MKAALLTELITKDKNNKFSLHLFSRVGKESIAQ